MILGIAALVLPKIANAVVTEPVVKCGDVFNYTKSQDFTDSKVVIDFSSNDKSISVSAKSGYAITKVELDIQNDGHNGYVQVSTGPLTNFDPNPGDKIDSAKVEVTKVCTGVCNDPKASNYKELIEGQTVANNELCVFPVATPAASIATPAATVLPNTGSNWGTILVAVILFAAGYLIGWVINRK
jgi:hypothetical protein